MKRYLDRGGDNGYRPFTPITGRPQGGRHGATTHLATDIRPTTTTEAKAYRQERLREHRHGGTRDPSGCKITVAERWERWSTARQTTDSTTARERSIWGYQIEPRIGAVRLADLRRSYVAASVVSLFRLP